MVCDRTVWNDALWLYKKAELEQTGRPKDISRLCITEAKKTAMRAWLSEVSSVVLQQSFIAFPEECPFSIAECLDEDFLA
jgi:putative transposase